VGVIVLTNSLLAPMPDNAVSRKFIDLIFQATAKWANWNPPSNIKVRISISAVSIAN
jgi:hypothetical protein